MLYKDFLLCLKDITSHKPFSKFPTGEERAKALLSHLRDARAKMVESVRNDLEKKRGGASQTDILERKGAALYNKVKWNEIDIPTFRVDLPSSLHLTGSQKAALSIIDEVIYRAFKMHELLSIPRKPKR